MPPPSNLQDINALRTQGLDTTMDVLKNAEIDGFKGFDKVPRVVLERYNIVPYLKSLKTSISPRESCEKWTGNFHPSFFNSKVKLYKDNLEKLREVINSGASLKYKCTICEKRYPDEKKLLNHHEHKHLIINGPLTPRPQKKVSFSDNVIVHEVKEYHKCRKCTKIFKSYRLLKLHMKAAHKKRKCYICNYCTMSFVDRTIFKVHIKLHCDVCCKLFPNRSKYVEHRRLVCKIDKKFTKLITDTTVNTTKDLRTVTMTQSLFTCTLCFQHFINKCSLDHHNSFVHLNNPSNSEFEIKNTGKECLYTCRYCQECFILKALLEKHVGAPLDLSDKEATILKKKFLCDYCNAKYENESDMLSHKWGHFLSKTKQNGYDNVKDTASTTGVVCIEENSTINVNPTQSNVHNHNNTIENNSKKSGNGPKKLSKSPKSIHVDDLGKPLEELTPEDIAALDKPVVKSGKTLFSKFQCEHCCKFFSSSYCLRRHIESCHSNESSLQCSFCEETFVWPSLLASHRCIRNPLPEIPFDDARPEIVLFDSYHGIEPVPSDINGTEINQTSAYVDFEIPAAIMNGPDRNATNSQVLSEIPIQNTNGFQYDCAFQNGGIFQNGGSVQNGGLHNGTPEVPNSAFVNNNHVNHLNPALNRLQNLGYKVVVQEVPIEF